MDFIYLSLIFSVLIGMLIIAKIRSYDLYEKEAFISMFMAFMVGGSVSVILALISYELLGLIGLQDEVVNTAAGSLLVIGPVEELSKLVGLMVVYMFIKKQFNEVTDGVIYMACVALGFSIIENYFYANAGENAGHLLFYRVLICTPAHISFSSITGYAFYLYKSRKKSVVSLIYALLLAVILHGIYDALVFSHIIRFLLIIYLYLILHQALKLVQYTNIMSPFRPNFPDLFSTPDSNVTVEVECPYCKSKTNKQKIENSYFTAYRCDACGYHLTSVKTLNKIFRSFAPEYKNFRKKLYPVKLGDGRRYMSVYGSAFFEEGAEMGFFKISDMTERMSLINQSIIINFRKTSFIPKGVLEKIIE